MAYSTEQNTAASASPSPLFAVPAFVHLCAAFGLLFVGGWFLQFSTGIDDAHITFFAAHELANTGEILNYNLERVEQSSSLLHVVLSALLVRLTGISAVAAGHLWPMLAAAITLSVLYKICRQLQLPHFVLLLFSSNAGLLFWAHAGLETPLVALLLLGHTWFAAHYVQHPKSTVMYGFCLCTFFLQLARPEMLFFTVVNTTAIVFLHAVIHKCFRRNYLLLPLNSALFATSITLWRHWYFGDYFPQPVVAKSAGITAASLHNGWQYFAGVFQHWPTATAAVVGVTACARIIMRYRQPGVPVSVLSIAITCIGYTMVIVVMGGDWMPQNRFWVTLLPLYCVLIAFTLSQFASARNAMALLFLLLAANVADMSKMVRENSQRWHNLNEMHRDARDHFDYFESNSAENLANIPTVLTLEKFAQARLAEQKERELHVLSGQMGMVSYHLAVKYPGLFRFTDRNALIARELTRCSLTRDRPRAQQGIDGLATIFFIKKAEQLKRECDIAPPDVIFDLWWHNKTEESVALLEKQGYHAILVDKAAMPLLDQVVLVRRGLEP